MSGVDTILKSVLCIGGFAATGWAMVKFIVNSEFNVQELSEHEKGMDIGLVFKEDCSVIEYIVEELEKYGLIVRKCPSNLDKNPHFLIGASEETLCLIAERMKLPFRGKDGQVKPFRSEQMNDSSNNTESVFSSGERARIIEYILDDIQIIEEYPPSPFLEHDNLISAAKTHGFLLRHVILHNDKEKDFLMKNWVKSYKEQPLPEIKAYYGEEVGLYFGFLGVYTKWLVLPSFLGGLLFLYQMFYGVNVITAIYAFFLTVWATAFLESWKRQQSLYSWKWGVYDCEDEERELPEFQGRSEFDPLEGKRVKTFTTEDRIKRYAVTIPIVLLMISILIAFTAFYLYSQDWVEDNLTEKNGWDGIYSYAKMLPSIGYSVGILIFDTLHSSLATTLTKYENHRIHTNYSNAIVMKLIAFFFVNNFAGLFYIAFVKQDFELLEETLSNCCISRQLIGNIQETLIPYIRGTSTVRARVATKTFYSKNSSEIDSTEATTIEEKGKLLGDHEEKASNPTSLSLKEKNGNSIENEENGNCIENEKDKVSNCENQCAVSKLDMEMALEEYDGTFADFLELFVQFGQVTLFAAAYPLAAFCALVNNTMEIRSDAFKLCASTSRPTPIKCSTIGAWLPAFTALGYAAVFTNCAMIGIMQRQSGGYLSSYRSSIMLLFIFGAEHLLILLKVIIEAAVPDTPWIVLKALEDEKKRQKREERHSESIETKGYAIEFRKSVNEVQNKTPVQKRRKEFKERSSTESPMEWMKWVQEEQDKRLHLEEKIRDLEKMVEKSSNKRKED